MTSKPRKNAGERITVQGPLEVLYDPRGPVTVDPEVRETTPEEQAEFRRKQDRRERRTR